MGEGRRVNASHYQENKPFIFIRDGDNFDFAGVLFPCVDPLNEVGFKDFYEVCNAGNLFFAVLDLVDVETFAVAGLNEVVFVLVLSCAFCACVMREGVPLRVCPPYRFSRV